MVQIHSLGASVQMGEIPLQQIWGQFYRSDDPTTNSVIALKDYGYELVKGQSIRFSSLKGEV